jgi:hypothetical protein
VNTPTSPSLGERIAAVLPHRNGAPHVFRHGRLMHWGGDKVPCYLTSDPSLWVAGMLLLRLEGTNWQTS